jgi:hypothetical protein
MVEEVLDQWYGPQDAFYKALADDAISISCAGKRRCPTGLGIWCHSSNCRAGADLVVDRCQRLLWLGAEASYPITFPPAASTAASPVF